MLFIWEDEGPGIALTTLKNKEGESTLPNRKIKDKATRN